MTLPRAVTLLQDDNGNKYIKQGIKVLRKGTRINLTFDAYIDNKLKIPLLYCRNGSNGFKLIDINQNNLWGSPLADVNDVVFNLQAKGYLDLDTEELFLDSKNFKALVNNGVKVFKMDVNEVMKGTQLNSELIIESFFNNLKPILLSINNTMDLYRELAYSA